MSRIEYTPETDRERELWDYMTKHPEFSTRDLVDGTSQSQWACDNFMRKLKRLSIATFARTDGTTRLYTVFDASASADYSKARRQTREGAIWQAMRTLQTFSPPDLAMALSNAEGISREDITSYCSMLVRAKYLTVLVKAVPGERPPRYKLTRNTGPLPPLQKRVTAILDQNEDRLVYASGDRL